MELRIIYKYWQQENPYELQKVENSVWGTIGAYVDMEEAYTAFQTEGPQVPIVSLYGSSDD